MKQYTYKEFVRVLKKNDFMLKRKTGSHSIFVNKLGNHVSIPYKLNSVIALRLSKENKLCTQ